MENDKHGRKGEDSNKKKKAVRGHLGQKAGETGSGDRENGRKNGEEADVRLLSPTGQR